ncbi:hypothetical protein [Actinoplanes regularis]|uniref:hypothetical protein n=1 Tax=Actinoplanes regularis TaxID=52697 RepID=UPI0019437BE3|nr:hypothetical protein [Actinoplanes regularis]
MKADDFISAGDQWYGLLFTNPSLNLPPRLTSCFDFAFDDVSRDDEVGSLSRPFAEPARRPARGEDGRS